jgi:acetoacetyl-CoA reductase
LPNQPTPRTKERRIHGESHRIRHRRHGRYRNVDLSTATQGRFYRGGGLRSEFVPEGNVSDWESTTKAFEKVRNEVGEVDVLVNNAGITRDAMFRKMSLEDWTSVINTNLTSLFNVTKQVIDSMIERQWGRIINISSVNGQKGQFGQTNYSTAKAGLHGFTMALAQEVATKNITVNTVSPGYIGTDMVRAIRPEVLGKIVDGIPVRRLGTPNEIASMVAWLASGASGFATGADFSLNGGLHMG